MKANRNVIYIVTGIALILALVGTIIALRSPHNDGGPKISEAATKKDPQKVMIYYTNYGFNPNVLSVPLRSHVTVKNISDGPLVVKTIYGQDNPELELGDIAKGESKEFTMAHDGVWQYEGNRNPEIRGEIRTGPLTPNLHAQQPGSILFRERPGQANGNPVLNLGVIEKQQRKSFKLTSKGTWQYEHAHQAPFGKGFGQVTAY